MDLKRRRLLIFLLIAISPLILGALASKYGKLPKLTPPEDNRIEVTKVEPKPAELQTGPFNCPSLPEFCQNGHDIFHEGRYMGFGGEEASGSPIYASFDGEVSAVITTLPNQEKLITVYLDNTERGLRAVYYYQGEIAPENGPVTTGKKIDVVGKPMSLYNASLIFALIKNDFINGEPTTLSSKDFK